MARSVAARSAPFTGAVSAWCNSDSASIGEPRSAARMSAAFSMPAPVAHAACFALPSQAWARTATGGLGFSWSIQPKLIDIDNYYRLRTLLDRRRANAPSLR